MSKRKAKIDWTETPAGLTAYAVAKADAQRRADETGFDYRVERNDVFKTYMVGMLPAKQNRYGFELFCEVVSCTDLSRCQPGHGPGAIGRTDGRG